MNIQVSTDSHIQGSAELTSQVEAVLEDVLGRYADRITRVEVHLSDENSSEKSGDDDKRCVLEARLAGVPPIVASHHGAAWQQALNGAAEILAKTLKRTLERKNSLFKRRSRMRSEFTTVDPLLQRGAQSGDQAEFVARLQPLTGHFRDHVQRELRMLETNGLLHRDQVTVDNLSKEVMTRAWLRYAERPREMPLDLWLVSLLDETIDEKISPESRKKKSLAQHSSETRSEDSFGVDDQQWWVWLLGEDEAMSLGDTLSGGESSAAEQFEASELKSRVHALLGAMPIGQRQAFVLHVLEAYELFELAMLQDRPEAEIQADIERVYKAIREQLSTRD